MSSLKRLQSDYEKPQAPNEAVLRLEQGQESHALTDLLEEDIRSAEDYLQHQHAESTQRAYQSDWRRFMDWCQSRDLTALPAQAETVALFLASEAAEGLARSTLERRTDAIRLAHRTQGHDSPTQHESVKAILRGIRRKHRDRPKAQKAPALSEDIKAMVSLIDVDCLPGKRDYALLLLGFAGAFRRSELVAIEVQHLQWTPKGLRIQIPYSKGDQTGDGQIVAIVPGQEYCPIKAIKDWLQTAQITDGPVFRRFQRGGHVGKKGLNPATVAQIVKQAAARAGLDPAHYAGHSLRSGFLTSAAQNGASLFKLQEISRHQSMETLRSYVRQAELFEDHAGEDLL